MAFTLILGLALIACTVWLILHAAGVRRARVSDTLSGMTLYGFQQPSAAERQKRGTLTEGLDELATRLGEAVGRFTGLVNEEEMRRVLRSAGMYTTSARKFMGYRVLAGVVCPLLWIWLGVSSNYSPIRVLFGFVIAVFAGWYGPLVLVRRRARYRLDEIDYQMPELIDVLVTTVEAGVGFSGSLQLAARRLAAPLGDELRLMLQEQDMGLSTQEALTNLVDRVPTPAIRTFVRAVIQGETLGVSIGKIMRDLAVEMRKNRRQKAEERAQKAPTKMLFPLVFLIFPAMFVVMLGPALIEIINGLKGA